MSNQYPILAGCHYIGEFVDEAAHGLLSGPQPKGGPVHPHRIFEFLDSTTLDSSSLHDYRVLLKDGSFVIVRANGYKFDSGEASPDQGAYIFSLQMNSREFEIAKFKFADVVGIFEGDLGSDLKTA